MEPPISPVLFAFLLFIGMLSMFEAGRFVAIRRRPREAEGERGNLGTLEGAVFALFGLMMAFTFSGAASRFSEKRMLTAEEINAVETAYLRLHLLCDEARPELQDLFRRYVDSRIETYRRLPDLTAAQLEMENSRHLQEEIWTGAIAALRLPGSDPAAPIVVLPALNTMIDMATTRTMALQQHPPRIVYFLLFVLGLLCALLAGYRMAAGPNRSWLHILAFTVVTVIIAYVVLDVEYPRAGLIRLETADQMITDMRARMK